MPRVSKSTVAAAEGRTAAQGAWMVAPAPPAAPPPAQGNGNGRSATTGTSLAGLPKLPGVIGGDTNDNDVVDDIPSKLQQHDVRKGESASTASAAPDSVARRRRASIVEALNGSGWDDEDAGLDHEQLGKLAEEYKFRLTKDQIRDRFDSMAKVEGREDGKIGPKLVEDWIRQTAQGQRRDARKVARSLFVTADDDSSGFLEKDEVAQVAASLKKKYPEFGLDPPFDLESDFGLMDRDGAGQVIYNNNENDGFRTRNGGFYT